MANNPELQPSLEIFPEDTVCFTRRFDSPRKVEGKDEMTSSELVEIPVSEIDNLNDPRLRQVLWGQHAATRNGNKSIIFSFAKEDGTYAGSVACPTELLGEKFTEDGPVKDEDYPAYLERKQQEKVVTQKSAGFISKLFRKKR